MISDQDKSCASKSYFASKSGAKKAARHFAGMHVYRCRFCPGYHLFRPAGIGPITKTQQFRAPNKCKRAGVRSNRRPRVEEDGYE